LSSHAAAAFAIATSTFMTSRRLHPTGRLRYVVAGVGAGMATFVAVARILAGRHFITDSLGGTIVGISVGVLVPALHDAPVTIVPSASAEQRGLSFVGRF
jgi:membrane-associated phospholipid phosphatase